MIGLLKSYYHCLFGKGQRRELTIVIMILKTIKPASFCLSWLLQLAVLMT